MLLSTSEFIDFLPFFHMFFLPPEELENALLTSRQYKDILPEILSCWFVSGTH